MPSPRHFSYAALLTGALLCLAAPLPAQSGDTAANIRAHDFNAKTQEQPSPGQQAYTNAMGYVQRIKQLEGRQKVGEALSARDEKKLEKYYQRAVDNLGEAIDEAPVWKEPRVTLGALLFNQGDYRVARAAFQAVLELDPDDRAAQDFSALCDQHLEAEAEPVGR